MHSAQGTSRDLPLDFVKGMLVIVMVIYHVMNIFSTASAEAYGYIRFVSGSFIFISGYIISTFYEQKFQKDRIGTSERLVARGLKLLLIFTILNILIHLTGFGNPDKTEIGMQKYLNNLLTIYILGDSRYASFQILIPISYLLILSPVFLLLHESRKFLTLVSLMVAFCFSFLDIKSFNIGFVIIGIIGISIGMVMNKLEVSFVIKSRPIIFSCLLPCIYLMGYMDRNVMTYSIGIMIVIKLFYDIGKTAELGNHINKAIILFGQYSLLCYIVQIIFLQGLFRVLSRDRGELGYEIISIIIIANIFLLALCFVLRFLRNQYRIMDNSYRFVFS
jgi:peptidoglycan/LPS O-acetylase OafA/YrhL